jgi:Tol biopolymer transport system component
MRRRLAPSALALFLVTSPALRAQGAIDPDGGLPLEPKRWARFTTDEGTWISLDVSHDGGTVVFDLLGDIYTVPITGGTATRLTHGIAHDMQPRYSPDGSRIVFVSDRSGDNNIWLLTPATGATTQVSKGVGYA